MEANINIHQLNLFLRLISEKYELYGHKMVDDKVIFDKIENPSDLYLGLKRKTVIPFKKIIFPNHQVPTKNERKIALVGLNNCDSWALEKLLKEFSGYDLLPKKENIFVMVEECIPDDNCFCSMMGSNKINPITDCYLQKEKGDYSLFAFSEEAKSLAKAAHIQADGKPKLNPIECEADFSIDKKKLTEIIGDRKSKEELWQNLSDNCFGCGACTAVCPLCFCTRQEFENTADGGCKMCLNWDSCFSKRFSEIQRNFDLRPDNVDRFYNWYHHKFVRAVEQNNHFLCVGCGRCTRACPANLNIKKIINNLLND